MNKLTKLVAQKWNIPHKKLPNCEILMTIIENVFIFMSMHIEHSLKGSILHLHKCLMSSRKKRCDVHLVTWKNYLCKLTHWMISMPKPWSSKLRTLECWILMLFNSFYSFHFHISPFSPLLSPLFGLVLIFHSPYFSISLLYLFISFLLCSFQTCQNPKLFWNFKPHEPPSMEDLGFFVLLKIAKTFSLCTKTCSHTKNILDWVVSNLICMKLFTNFNVNLHSNLR